MSRWFQTISGVAVPHEETFVSLDFYSTATGYVMPNIAYLVSGLFKDRMRSRRCAIVFTHRIVAKTRAAVASALFDTGTLMPGDCHLLADKRVSLRTTLSVPEK